MESWTWLFILILVAILSIILGYFLVWTNREIKVAIGSGVILTLRYFPESHELIISHGNQEIGKMHGLPGDVLGGEVKNLIINNKNIELQRGFMAPHGRLQIIVRVDGKEIGRYNI